MLAIPISKVTREDGCRRTSRGILDHTTGGVGISRDERAVVLDMDQHDRDEPVPAHRFATFVEIVDHCGKANPVLQGKQEMIGACMDPGRWQSFVETLDSEPEKRQAMIAFSSVRRPALCEW